MGIFIVIVLAWAIGMGGLILWQITHHSSKDINTDASNTYQSAPDSPPSSHQSKFGQLLK